MSKEERREKKERREDNDRRLLDLRDTIGLDPMVDDTGPKGRDKRGKSERRRGSDRRDDDGSTSEDSQES